MFDNVGQTLSVLRELRGKSQARLSKDAGIGKSQLSKYENGKELPKLDSLEKVLNALRVSYFEFFYTLHLLDRRAADLALETVGAGEAPAAASSLREPPLYMPPLFSGKSLLAEPTEQAFSQVFTDLLFLHRRLLEQTVLAGVKTPKERKTQG